MAVDVVDTEVWIVLTLEDVVAILANVVPGLLELVTLVVLRVVLATVVVARIDELVCVVETDVGTLWIFTMSVVVVDTADPDVIKLVVVVVNVVEGPVVVVLVVTALFALLVSVEE